MLLFDLTATQPIGNIIRHGGGIYAEIVFFKLIEKSKDFACYFDSSRWINPNILEECKKRNIKLYDINTEDLNIFSDSYTHLYSSLPNFVTQNVKIRKIFTLHGLRVLETPTDTFIKYYTKSYKSKLKDYIKGKFVNIIKRKELNNLRTGYLWDKNNVELITVSNHSRTSIELVIPEIKQYNIPIRVYYAPDTSALVKNNFIKNAAHLPFYLMVSGNRWVKNCLRAIIAFDELITSGYAKGVSLKIAGVKREEIDYKFNNSDRIEFLGYITDDELTNLYSTASLFIYPSLNEGFGYPPLEAMRFQTPVIASCFTSIPEICGDAAMYFNPLSILEIKNRLLQMEDISLRNEYISKGLKRYHDVRNRQIRDLDEMTDYLLENK